MVLELSVIGNIGGDAVVRDVNGLKVINFNVAHSEKWKDKAGVQQEKTTWISCAYWDERANLAPYLKKGTLVLCEGTPDPQAYPRKDGSGYSVDFKLTVRRLRLLSAAPKPDANKPATGQPATTAAAFGDAGGDDLPF